MATSINPLLIAEQSRRSSGPVGRALAWTALGLSAACWAVFPLLYVIADAFVAAHAATDSEGGMFFWGMTRALSSAAFIAGNGLAAALGLWSHVVRRRAAYSPRRLTALAFAVPAGSVLLHLIVDYVL